MSDLIATAWHGLKLAFCWIVVLAFFVFMAVAECLVLGFVATSIVIGWTTGDEQE